MSFTFYYNVTILIYSRTIFMVNTNWLKAMEHTREITTYKINIFKLKILRIRMFESAPNIRIRFDRSFRTSATRYNLKPCRMNENRMFVCHSIDSMVVNWMDWFDPFSQNAERKEIYPNCLHWIRSVHRNGCNIIIQMKTNYSHHIYRTWYEC